MISAAIAGALLGGDLVRLVTKGRVPPGELRHVALSAAALLAAVGMTSRRTSQTLELARRLEHARFAGELEARMPRHPLPGVSRDGARLAR